MVAPGEYQCDALDQESDGVSDVIQRVLRIFVCAGPDAAALRKGDALKLSVFHDVTSLLVTTSDSEPVLKALEQVRVVVVQKIHHLADDADDVA